MCHVPILTQPESQVLQGVFAFDPSYKLFQSSPSPKARCYWRSYTSSARYHSRCSNPHPARKPGATITRQNAADIVVPILTQPESQVLRHLADFGDCSSVPILTQPESQVLRHLADFGDCSSVPILTQPESQVLLWREATGTECLKVPILTQPESQVLLEPYFSKLTLPDLRSNPHPARKPGAT